MNCYFGTQAACGATCRTTRSNDAGMPTSGICERPGDGGDAAVDAVVDGRRATSARRIAADARATRAQPFAADAPGG